MPTPRTLITGLDGATFDLITPLVRAGYLPTLAQIMAQGVCGPLQAWPNMNSAAAWSSMITGYNPGQHGIYDFGDAPPQRGVTWHPTTAADRQRDPFWRRLSAAGQRVGVINVPISYPADPATSFMLAGMDAPGVHSPRFAHPPDLYHALRRQGLDYVIDVPNLGVLRQRQPHQLPQPVQRLVEIRARTILHLMATRPWDVLMAVFTATDRVQHHFWPDERSDVEHSSWLPIRSLYQQIDAFFSNALASLNANTTVLVVSDHGFGPLRVATRCLNQLFARLGWLCYRQTGRRSGNWLLKHLLLYGRRLIPLSLQDPLARTFPRLRLRAVNERAFADIVWAHTQVFARPVDGRVFINLQGREAEGTVAPAEYHAFREQVRDVLLHLTDADSGRRVIRAVHRREELYCGPYVEKAPDLLVEWDEEVVRDTLCYAVGKPIVVRAPQGSSAHEQWKGNHRTQGIFIAYGPPIKRGATVVGATLYDITPTLLYLQGQPIPRDMDGRVLTDILTAEHLRRHPVQQDAPASSEVQATAAELGAEEAHLLTERLRRLGYFE